LFVDNPALVEELVCELDGLFKYVTIWPFHTGVFLTQFPKPIFSISKGYFSSTSKHL
jgi:hypothetical protein